MIKYVFDACAIITWMRSHERGHRYMVEFIKGHGYESGIHAMNLSEVYYKTIEQADASRAERMVELLTATGITILEEMPTPLWKDAGWLKVNYSLGFLDAIALATARHNEAVLVTQDKKAFEGIKKAFPQSVKLF